MFKKMIATGSMLGALLVAGQVQAVEIDTVTIDLTADWNTFVDERNYDENGIKVTVSGFTSDVTPWQWCSPWPACATDIDGENVSSFSDYGIGVGGPGTGAGDMIDNQMDGYFYKTESYDMMLFVFDQAVSLEAVSAGYVGNGYGYAEGQDKNSEMSVLSYQGDYNGDDIASTFIDDSYWTDLIDDTKGGDWVGEGDYVLGTDYSKNTLVSTDNASRYWLVGAFNSNLGGNGSEDGSGFSEYNDFFKLSSVTVSSVNPVPIPGSMLLFGAALMGFGIIRRKKKV